MFCSIRERVGLREESVFDELPFGSGHAVLRAVRKDRSHRDDSLKSSTDRPIHSKLLINVAIFRHYSKNPLLIKEDDIQDDEHSKNVATIVQPAR